LIVAAFNTPTRKCKTCGEVKAYREVDRGYGTRRFVGDSGGMWNGRVCYECYRVYMRERSRQTRARDRGP
jgi:hypothetical protein